MKMNLRIAASVLFVVVFILLFSQCRRSDMEDYPFEFHFITEQYKPFNYTQNGTLTGLSPETLRVICENLDIPFEVDVLPWEQGYSRALQEDNAVLFATILNKTRKDLFKWAGPIASFDWIFYSKAQNPLYLSSLEDAKSVQKIGVLADYAITQYLQEQGFTNLVMCTNDADAFQKLLSGEIDLYPSNKLTAQSSLSSLSQLYYAVSERLIIRTDMVYFAFNKQVPDAVVADFQTEIDRMKTNGTMVSLYRKFMNTSDFPESFQIYTENYPPLSFRDSYGNVSGFGTEVTKEIMARNQVYSEINLSLWSIGYDLALNNPNFCLFTMDKTPARDTLFQWVGPLGTNTTFFYTKTGSGISILSLEDAKNLSSVGVVNSWFSTQYLLSIGFTNLVSHDDPVVMAQKLMNGEVQAFVCSSVTFPDILRAAGYAYNQATPSFALMSSDYYIAFSKNTPASIPAKWQASLDAMKADGTYQAIRQKWLP